MTRVFNGERTCLVAGAAAGRDARSIASAASMRRASSTGSPTRSPCCCFTSAAFVVLYALMRLQAVLPFNPAEQSAVAPDLVVQHRGQLHHQHQLAELRRRKHDVLSRADARPDAPELPVGRDRHRARGRADPRLRARLGQDRRQFLGRCHPLHALRAAADLRCRTRCSWSGRACRRRSAPMSTRRRWKARKQTIALGPVASQVAIKMLGTNGGGFFNANAAHPFENPTALSNFVQMHLDLRARRGAHQRVRPHGRQPAPGLGAARRDGRAVHRRRRRHLLGGSVAAPTRSTRSASPAATWKARRSASASSPPRCSR